MRLGAIILAKLQMLLIKVCFLRKSLRLFPCEIVGCTVGMLDQTADSRS